MCAQADGQERYHNLGAVAVLRGPSWDTPSFVQYEAVHPRPQVEATYEVSPQHSRLEIILAMALTFLPLLCSI